MNKRRVTRVLCCNCDTVLTVSGNQYRRCRCGDITLFGYPNGLYDIAYRKNSQFKLLSHSRPGGRAGWIKGVKNGR